MTRYGIKSGGWFGNPQGHSLAARGVSLYAKKSRLHDPIFYAQKSEKTLPFAVLMDHVRNGQTFKQIKMEHPDADPEDIRLRGIKALETLNGTSTLTKVNRMGVDDTVSMAKKDKKFGEQLSEVMNDQQQVSFIQDFKVESIKNGLKGVQ